MDTPHKCSECDRPGKLVIQERAGIPDDPFVFRYYLCPWHLAASNREIVKWSRRPLEYIDFKPDSEFGL
jgi:hypothetical protein